MKNEMIINKYIETVIEACRNINRREIIDIYNILIKAIKTGGKIYICGNGGSASTASHFHTDLNNAFSISQNTMPAICFTDNVSNITTQKTIEKSYKMQDDLIIVTDRFYSTVTKYEINNDLKDEINIKITYYNKYNDYEISKDNNYIMLDHKDLYKIPVKDMYKIVVNDLNRGWEWLK